MINKKNAQINNYNIKTEPNIGYSDITDMK